ncbi:MAG: phosphate ABC transporter permease PstA [Akkermansiaceae bacterium]
MEAPSSSLNPFVAKTRTRRNKDFAGSVLFAAATYFLLTCAVWIFCKIAFAGVPVLFDSEDSFINWDFLTKSPETLVVFENEAGDKVKMDQSDFTDWKKENPDAVINNEKGLAYTGGGILGPLVGTALLVVVCMVVALIVGIAAAIFLNEYAGQGRFIGMIRLAIMNLAGVPSIVFGLFGFAAFCLALGMGASALAGGLTLAVMVLPVIIAACEESLKAVPKGFREASLALGATKWQCIRTAVLPYAAPGILTASILGVTRVAGETAPIMFTAAVADKASLPGGLMDSVQALPYHIYTFARLPSTPETIAVQNGTVFVFLMLVMGFSGLSIFFRILFRSRLKW